MQQLKGSQRMATDPYLLELLRHVGALNGTAALLSEEELAGSPAATVIPMKAHGLLSKATPASSAVCPGCERQCTMPVHILRGTSNSLRAFIVCDKRSDINRVTVSTERLEQWQVSAESIAALIANLLGLHPPPDNPAPGRWLIGVYKGKKHSSHLVLLADGELKLTLAGHSIALTDVLDLTADRFIVDKRRLDRLVDNPAAGGGATESAASRQRRLIDRVNAERSSGNRAFLKAVAHEEGISTSRLKQIIRPEAPPAAHRPGTSSRSKRPISTQKNV